MSPVSSIDGSNPYGMVENSANNTVVPGTVQGTRQKDTALPQAAVLKTDDVASQGSVPSIPKPTGSPKALQNVPEVNLSLGALLMRAMAQTAAEERRKNAEQRAVELDIITDSIKTQAREMETKAIVQLVVGVAAGGLSIAQGVMSAAMMKKGMDKIDAKAGNAEAKPDAKIDAKLGDAKGNNESVMIEMDDIHPQPLDDVKAHANPQVDANVNADAKVDARPEVKADAKAGKAEPNADDYLSIQNQQMILNQRVGAFNSIMGGSTSMIGKISETTGAMMDSHIKLEDVTQERARAQNEALRSLEESNLELIRKAVSSMEAIQNSQNQATAKILG